MAEFTSGWSSEWTPSGSGYAKKYRANISATLNTYSTYCTISYTHRLEVNSKVEHDDYQWSVGGYPSGSGTVDSTMSAYIFNCKSGTSSSVTRGHTATTIYITGSIWAKSSGGSNPWSNQVVTATASFTVPALQSWTVTYNANGGTGSATDTKWYGESLTLSSGTGFSWENHTLLGWNTAADGSGTHYDLSDTYTGNAALTLYAEWHLDAIEVQTKVNGAWKDGIFYVKVNGEWVIPPLGYVKVNGSWEQIKKE